MSALWFLSSKHYGPQNTWHKGIKYHILGEVWFTSVCTSHWTSSLQSIILTSLFSKMSGRSGRDILHWFLQSSNMMMLRTVASICCSIDGWCFITFTRASDSKSTVPFLPAKICWLMTLCTLPPFKQLFCTRELSFMTKVFQVPFCLLNHWQQNNVSMRIASEKITLQTPNTKVSIASYFPYEQSKRIYISAARNTTSSPEYI